MSGSVRATLVLAVAVLLATALVSVALADVERHQLTSYTLEIDSLNDDSGLTHTFDVTYNPCDDSFLGTGIAHHENEGKESLSEFDLSDHTLTFRSDYDFMTYTWYPSFTLNDDQTLTFHDGAGPDNVFAATGTWSMESTDYRNHGEYVAQNHDSAPDAAHSCIGMPVHAHGAGVEGAVNGKVTICHVNGSTGAAPSPVGPDPSDTITYGRSITVAVQAYRSHMAHGDGEVEFNPTDHQDLWIYGEALGVAGNSNCAFNVAITPEGVSGENGNGAGPDSGNTNGVVEETTICHKGKKTLTVGDAAVAAHLNHGDVVGACP